MSTHPSPGAESEADLEDTVQPEDEGVPIPSQDPEDEEGADDGTD